MDLSFSFLIKGLIFYELVIYYAKLQINITCILVIFFALQKSGVIFLKMFVLLYVQPFVFVVNALTHLIYSNFVSLLYAFHINIHSTAAMALNLYVCLACVFLSLAV